MSGAPVDDQDVVPVDGREQMSGVRAPGGAKDGAVRPRLG